MKFWILTTLFTVSILNFSGCGVKPAPKKEIVVDESLPVITLTKYGIIPDMNSVAFEWNKLENPKVKGIYIYKHLKGDKNSKDDFYKAIDNRFATHFVDQSIEPNSEYVYYFKTFSKDAHSKPSKTFSVKSLEALNSVSWLYAVSDMPRSVKLLWRPHTNPRVHSYVIYRKDLTQRNYEEIATVDGRLSAEYIDTDLLDNREYQYRIKVLTYDDILSKQSDVVSAVTRALPKSIENIKATKNLANSIKISWDKSSSKYFHQYYVYRSESADGSYELIATLYNNHFLDKIQKDGKEYFYRVTAVDVDSLESTYDSKPVVGISLTKPKAPIYVKATLEQDAINVTWTKNDKRTVAYKVVRIEQRNWFKKVIKEFKNIEQESLKDTTIKKGYQYSYEVYALDKHGIVSKPNASNEILVPLPVEIKKESNSQSTTTEK